jgi:hypothetical protein
MEANSNWHPSTIDHQTNGLDDLNGLYLNFDKSTFCYITSASPALLFIIPTCKHHICFIGLKLSRHVPGFQLVWPTFHVNPISRQNRKLRVLTGFSESRYFLRPLFHITPYKVWPNKMHFGSLVEPRCILVLGDMLPPLPLPPRSYV